MLTLSLPSIITCHIIVTPRVQVLRLSSGLYLTLPLKLTRGILLNDKLLVGPRLQDDIFEHLVRFRFHQVALSADVQRCTAK